MVIGMIPHCSDHDRNDASVFAISLYESCQAQQYRGIILLQVKQSSNSERMVALTYLSVWYDGCGKNRPIQANHTHGQELENTD